MNKNRIRVDALVEDEKMIWFTSQDYNAFFCMNKNGKKIRYLGEIPGEETSQVQLYNNIIKCGDELVFIPANAEAIAIYNIVKEIFRKIKVQDPLFVSSHINYSGKYKFMAAATWGRSVYILGTIYPAIMKLNLDTGETKYYDKAYRQIDQIDKDRDIYFHKTISVDKNIFYAPVAESNIIMKFDMETDRHEFIEIGARSNLYIGIYQRDDLLWLTHRYGARITAWNISTHQIKEYYLPFIEDNLSSKSYFFNLVGNAEKLYLFGYGIKRSFVLNIETGEFQEIDFEDKIEEYHSTEEGIIIYFKRVSMMNDTITLVSDCGQFILVYNLDNNSFNKIILSMPTILKWERDYAHRKYNIPENHIFRESKQFDLDFLNYIVHQPSFEILDITKEKKEVENCGKRIHYSIKAGNN